MLGFPFPELELCLGEEAVGSRQAISFFVIPRQRYDLYDL